MVADFQVAEEGFLVDEGDFLDEAGDHVVEACSVGAEEEEMMERSVLMVRMSSVLMKFSHLV